jgi:hypothetical protein
MFTVPPAQIENADYTGQVEELSMYQGEEFVLRGETKRAVIRRLRARAGMNSQLEEKRVGPLKRGGEYIPMMKPLLRMADG